MSAVELGSSVNANDKGLHRRTAGLQLIRYHIDCPCTPDNLVLLTDEQASEFHAMGLQLWVAKNVRVAKFCDAMLHRVGLIFGRLD